MGISTKINEYLLTEVGRGRRSFINNIDDAAKHSVNQAIYGGRYGQDEGEMSEHEKQVLNNTKNHVLKLRQNHIDKTGTVNQPKLKEEIHTYLTNHPSFAHKSPNDINFYSHEISHRLANY